MFDFTKSVSLDPENYNIYRRCQTAVYLIAAVLLFFLAYLILFPSQKFVFYPPTPNSDKNTIINPRDGEGNVFDHAKADSTKKLIFDTALVGNYSQIQVDITLNKKSNPIDGTVITTKKSYQSFLYPEGEPVGFKDGTLIKNKNDYYIVSQEKLRKFASESIVELLGFQKEAFQETSDSDLKYNGVGDAITSESSYPDGSIFKIDDNYYILNNQKLEKFVSPQAYLTQYNEDQAILKNEDFFQKYARNDGLIGFEDGTLVSYGISANIASSGIIHPIDNPTTFTSMGYKWPDVVPASGDEISLYQKDKLFNINGAHPSGTVMKTAEDGRWYLIKDGQKHFLSSSAIARSWSKSSPISVSSKSLNEKAECSLSKKILSFRTYSCSIPMENFKELLGKDYEFTFNSPEGITADAINISFEKTATWENLKLAVSNLINKIKVNYVPQAPVSAK